jgi:predicted RNA-binding protein with PIN domain
VGGLTVHFVVRSSTADQAIARRLASLGKAARNWTVVTSDRRVQEEARSKQAVVLPSEAFAREMEEALNQAEQRDRANPPRVHPDEIDEWLEFFQDDDQPE